MAQGLKLIWSPDALQDVDEIAEYISRDSAYYAQRVVEQIIGAAEILPYQPQLGRVVPELGSPAVRERFVYSYRLIYAVRASELHILAVIHGKRLLEAVEERYQDDL